MQVQSAWPVQWRNQSRISGQPVLSSGGTIPSNIFIGFVFQSSIYLYVLLIKYQTVSSVCGDNWKCDAICGGDLQLLHTAFSGVFINVFCVVLILRSLVWLHSVDRGSDKSQSVECFTCWRPARTWLRHSIIREVLSECASISRSWKPRKCSCQQVRRVVF